MKTPGDCAFVIFGASGDLAMRKLIPALFQLHRRGFTPGRNAVLGVGRTLYDDETFRKEVSESILRSAEGASAGRSEAEEFGRRFFYESIETSSADHYGRVKSRLDGLRKSFGTGPDCLFYLAVPPDLQGVIVENLAVTGLHREDSGGWRRLIVEKPFGRDLDSSRRLNETIRSFFPEERVYRIDHYLGKETVRNILALRFANGIFEPLWNRRYVDRVEITAAEQNGVEGRGGYYDRAGALRDMVQNHLLHLLAVIAMEPPSRFNADSVRNETIKVFDALRPVPVPGIEECVVRGQYTESMIRGERIDGYRQEDKVASESRTETFVALRLYVDNWRWGDVPFFIRTGKRLPTRVTEAVIHFKKTPHVLFAHDSSGDLSGNRLVIRIQPDEGILLSFGMKEPGSGFRIKTVSMDFRYADLGDAPIPSAYERLLLDCMLGDATLFTRSDAVEACWSFVTPILDAWESRSDSPIYGYPAGSWGPPEARRLFGDASLDWHYPCRNLVGDGDVCLL